MQFVQFEPVTQSFDVVFQSVVLGASALLAPRGVRLPLLPVYGYSVMVLIRYVEADPQLEPALGRDGRALQSAHRVTGHTLAGGRLCRVRRGLAAITPCRRLGRPARGASRPVSRRGEIGPSANLERCPPQCCPPVPRARAWRHSKRVVDLSHGLSGSALACGAARLLANMLAGRVTITPFDGLSVSPETLDHLSRLGGYP